MKRRGRKERRKRRQLERSLKARKSRPLTQCEQQLQNSTCSRSTIFGLEQDGIQAVSLVKGEVREVAPSPELQKQYRQKAVVRLAKAELDNVKEQMQRMQEEHKSNCQRHADMLTKVLSLIQAEPATVMPLAAVPMILQAPQAPRPRITRRRSNPKIGHSERAQARAHAQRM